MACNPCETNFQSAESVVLSIQRSGNTALLYVANQGRNIALIPYLAERAGSGASTWYLRPPPDPISWVYPSAYIEPGLTALYYQLANVSPGTIVQAQAEYVEIEGRSRSCPESF
jgi:hypothetical protein